MKLILYPKLKTKSKRAIRKTKKQWGQSYSYSPRYDLVKRLARETGWTENQILTQLYKERDFILKHIDYFR